MFSDFAKLTGLAALLAGLWLGQGAIQAQTIVRVDNFDTGPDHL